MSRQGSRRWPTPADPKNNKDEVRGRTDRQARKERYRQMTGRPALPGGRASEGGIGFLPKNAAPRPTAWSVTFGRITTNYMPHQHYMGGHYVCAAMQCSIIPQSPDDWPRRRYMRPTTARRTHTPQVDQQAGTSGPILISRTGAA